MKIGFFTNSYLPLPYGSTNSIRIFRRCFEKMGHRVIVFAPKFKGYSDGEDGENVFRYPAFLWRYKINYPIAISLFPPATKRAREEKLDIIHSHHPFSIGKDGARIAKKLNLPLVFTHHCRYEDYLHYVPLIPKRLLAWHVKKAATRFANRADLVIAPSLSIKKILIKRGVTAPIEVVPTGIDLEKFKSGKREETRKKLGIGEEEKVILNVGRVEAEKNVDLLFEAAVEVILKNKKVKLVFVGNGSKIKELSQKAKEKNIEDQVIFVGEVKYQDVQDYYSIGDIYLQTSTSETQGMTTLEAMAAGVPVVAVRATGVVDQIKDGENGRLVKENKKEIVTAVEDFLKNNKKRKEIIRRARNFVENFSQEKSAQKVLTFYEKLIRKKNGSQR